MTTTTVATKRTAPAVASGQRDGFAGTGALLRLALRRDRIIASIWVLLFVIMAASSSSASQDLFDSLQARVRAANAINDTPATLALYGRVFDPTSLGAVSLIKLGAMGAALVALVAIFTVVRHTRAEEEAGRGELLGATVVGRYAPLTAALLMSATVSIVLAILTALSLAGTGLPAAGAFAFGLSWAGAGIAFAAVGALAAQVTESARAARGIAAAVLAAAYLLRAAGDASGSSTWLSWLSPVGWAQQVRPFAGDRWWVLLYLLFFAALVAIGAYLLVARRDHGAGLVAQRPGKPAASTSLSTPLALAARLQRGSLIGWLIGAALGGLVIGSIASQVGEFLDTNSAKDMIMKLGGERGLVDAFLSAEMGILAVVVAAYGISTAMRMRAEETSLRAEPILATKVSRARYATSHIVIALTGSTLLLLAVGVFAGFAHGAASGDMSAFGRVLGAALVHLPAVWVLTGITVLVFGFAPGLIMAGWGALVVFLMLGQLGPIFNLPQWAMDISPFTHTPKLPGGDFSLTPLVWLTVVAAALIAAGLAGFRRRDIG